MKLEIISTKKDIKNIKSLKEIIAERKLLKTELKLQHIVYLDRDLKILNDNNLSLKNIDLESIYLTENYELYAPISDRIITKKSNDKIKLTSYLIYLSYIYNYDFLEVYNKDIYTFYKIIICLNINEKVKQSIFNLIDDLPAKYFSEHLMHLNNAIYKEDLYNDKLILKRYKDNVN